MSVPQRRATSKVYSLGKDALSYFQYYLNPKVLESLTSFVSRSRTIKTSGKH